MQELAFTGTDRFRVLRALGEGGMGVVYEALDREQGVRVALKRLHDSDALALLALKQEFRALRDLRHPNLVSLGELVQSGEHAFFTMELVEGPSFLAHVRVDDVAVEPVLATGQSEAVTLRTDEDTVRVDTQTLATPSGVGAELTVEEPRFHEARLRAALQQLAAGLCALHDAGKIHRDIKPPNLLVAHDGRLVITDFGLVTSATGASASELLRGTPAYMAPERVTSTSVEPASDWFSVGVVLYRALTGRLPFQGTSSLALGRLLAGEVVAPHAIVRNVPPDLDALCLELLRVDPRERPSGDDVLRRLGASTERRSASPRVAVGAPFVGRDAELATLGGWLAAALADDAPRTLVIQGESGLGKSALARQLRDATLAAGGATADLLWLGGRCHERESVPYKAVDGIIDQLTEQLAGLDDDALAAMLPADAALLGQLFPVLRRLDRQQRWAPLAAMGAAIDVDLRTRAFEALRALLSNVAVSRPVVLGIDDMQWTDDDSRALLLQLLTAKGSLALVATVRVGGEVPWLLEGAAADRARHLLLRPLSPADARELARRLVPVGTDVDVDTVADSAAGIPLFIEELVRHALPQERAQAYAVPLDDVLSLRVLQLPPDARRLLSLVALTGTAVMNEALRAAARLDAAGFAAARDLLERERLVRTSGRRRVDGVECYHDRIREIVATRIVGGARRQLHEDLAGALEDAGGDAELLSTLWHGAGDDQRAAVHAIRAAKEADDVLAFERAARLYRRAASLMPPDDPRACMVAERMATATHHAGRAVEAAFLLLDASRRTSGIAALALRRRGGETLVFTGHLREGSEVLRGLLGQCGIDMPTTRGQLVMDAVWQQLRLRLRGLAPKPAPATTPSAEHAFVTDVLRTTCRASALLDPMMAAAFSARHLRRALDVGDREQMFWGLNGQAAIVCAFDGGESDRVRELLAMADALAAGHRVHEMIMQGTRGMIALLFRGDPRDALERLLAAEAVMTEPGMFRDELAGTRFFANSAMWKLGAWRELRARVVQHRAIARDREDFQSATMMASGELNATLLMEDDPTAAHRALTTAMQRWPRERFLVAHMHELYARAQLHLYEGNAPAAHELLDATWPALAKSFMLRIPAIRHRMHALRARTLITRAAASDGRLRSSWLARAAKDVRVLAKAPLTYAAASALLLDGQRLHVAGRKADAAAKLQAAELALVAVGCRMEAAGAKLARGRALGSADDVAGALAVLQAEGVVAPERMARLLIADV